MGCFLGLAKSDTAPVWVLVNHQFAPSSRIAASLGYQSRTIETIVYADVPCNVHLRVLVHFSRSQDYFGLSTLGPMVTVAISNGGFS